MTTLLIVLAYLAVGVLFDLAMGLPERDIIERGVMTLLWPLLFVAFVLPALVGTLSYAVERLAKRFNRR